MEVEMLAMQLLGMALTAIAGFLGGKVKEQKANAKKRKEHDVLMEEGMKAILRRDIMDAYEKHVSNSEPLSIERRQELDDEYSVYEKLGGNGTGKEAYQQVCRVPMQIVN